jgi:hypothetical protein
MELFSGNGEPDIRERPFEELPGLEGFNAFYQRNGGVVCSPCVITNGQGGGINDRPSDVPIRPVPPLQHVGQDDLQWLENVKTGT